jgi:hypothetical protein
MAWISSRVGFVAVVLPWPRLVLETACGTAATRAAKKMARRTRKTAFRWLEMPGQNGGTKYYLHVDGY